MSSRPLALGLEGFDELLGGGRWQLRSTSKPSWGAVYVTVLGDESYIVFAEVRLFGQRGRIK
jgi:hypothetical protein